MHVPAHAKSFEIFCDDRGWWWRLVDTHERTVARSCDPATTQEECRRAVELIRGSWRASVAEGQRN